MFKPKKMSGLSRGEYHLSLTDYYTKGGRIEPDGVWFGAAAKAWGLEGKVTRRALRRLLTHRSPEGHALTQAAGRRLPVRYAVKLSKDYHDTQTGAHRLTLVGRIVVSAASKDDAEKKVQAMIADPKKPLHHLDSRITWKYQRRPDLVQLTEASLRVVSGETRVRRTYLQSGFDCVVAAPKSVSNVWAGRPELRCQIEKAHDEAVARMLADAEVLVGRTRRGKGGVEKEEAKIAVARFQHASTRGKDEHLHTHCLFLVPVLRKDGTSGALDSREIFRQQRTLGTLYLAYLAYSLQMKGFQLERRKDWGFEIKGVPESLIKATSTRDEEVRGRMAAQGASSGKAKELARLETRKEKELIPRAEYFKRWEKRAEAHGLTLEHAKTLVGEVPQVNTVQELDETLTRAVLRATAESSHFTEGELLRYSAEEAQCRGFDPTILRDAVKYHLTNTHLTVKLGRDERGDIRYTTPEMLRLEERLLSSAQALDRDLNTCKADTATIEEAIRLTEERETKKLRQRDPEAKAVSLSREQRAAIFHVTQARGRIAVVEGLAGVGKTTLLHAISRALEKEERTVIGTAISGKAVRELSQGAGIRSYTVARLVGAPELNFIGDFDREDDPKVTGGRERVTLSRDSVLVVDEAGMVGTRAMERLLRETEKAGATIVLVGDSAQLQPVKAAGGPFRSLAARLGSAKLTEITRQVNEWERSAVMQFPKANAQEALRAYVEKGMVWIPPTREEAIAELVAEWQRSGGVDAPRSHQVFTHTNRERSAVNSQIQDLLRREGKLGHLGVEVKDGEAFTGSRIMLLRNSSYLQVNNADLGTVTAVDPFRNRIEIELDRGGTVTVDLTKYGHQNLTLSFAITAHRGQGATVDYSYLLIGGSMTDLHSSYVMGSRARYGAKYFTDSYEAGDELADLAKQMNRRREKDLAHDILEANASGKEPRTKTNLPATTDKSLHQGFER